MIVSIIINENKPPTYDLLVFLITQHQNIIEINDKTTPATTAPVSVGISTSPQSQTSLFLSYGHCLK